VAETLLRLSPPDERAARRTLLDQIARLEEDLAGLFVSSWPRRGIDTGTSPSGAPRLLSMRELEALRDDLERRARGTRRTLAERTRVEEEHRCRIEEMLLHPDEHRWVRISNEDIGEPGCRHWHARPRWGFLGMFASWWRVVVSSGCPLPGPR
jgi:hypothetical protein